MNIAGLGLTGSSKASPRCEPSLAFPSRRAFPIEMETALTCAFPESRARARLIRDLSARSGITQVERTWPAVKTPDRRASRVVRGRKSGGLARQATHPDSAPVRKTLSEFKRSANPWDRRRARPPPEARARAAQYSCHARATPSCRTRAAGSFLAARSRSRLRRSAVLPGSP